MDIYKEIELQDCPICNGSGLLEEVNGWAYYVTCMDCGGHTAEFDFNSEEERLEAAKAAAYMWNMGKVLSSNPGE